MSERTVTLRRDLELPGGGTVTVGAVSSRGPRRRNEDNLLAIMPGGEAFHLDNEVMVPARSACWPGDGRWLRVAVADGMAGHECGQEAANAVIAALLEHPPFTSPAAMRRAVLDIHADLLAATGPGQRGCTLVLVDIDLHRRSAVLLNVGDSRGYLRHHQVVHCLTTDHRLAEFAFRDGMMAEADYLAAVARKSNRLAQAVGFGSHGILASDEEDSVNAGLRIDLSGHLPPRLAAHADAMVLGTGSQGDSLVLITDGALVPGCDVAMSDGADSVLELVAGIADNPAASDNATTVTVSFSAP